MSSAVALSDLQAGDTVLVRPGGRVPADGVVVDGAAEVDESMNTGESRTIDKQESDRVVAGTVATDSALRIRVSAVGEGTALAGIRRLVEQAQDQIHQLAAERHPETGCRAHGHRPGHRLRARPRPGHPAGDRHIHHRLGPRRHPREGRLALAQMRTIDAVLFDKTD